MKTIKKEILIAAPVARIWEHITDPKKIAGWLMPNDFEATVGKKFILDCQQQGKVSCVVKEIVPQQKLVYSFKSRVTKVETFVAITLAKEGKSTRLTLTHSGWDTLPPDEQGIADMFGGGWGSSLEKLGEQIQKMRAKQIGVIEQHQTRPEKSMPKIKTINGIKEHKVVSQKEWLAARKKLLVKEKKFSKLRDELNQQRRKLPWVKIEREYVFDGPQGKVTLAELFCGKSQLIVYHFMFGPGWEEGCPHCSFWADHYDSVTIHLGQRDTTLVVISRAPWKEIEPFKRRMGWRFKWRSSNRNDFNFDFHVSFTPREIKSGKAVYNYAKLDMDIDEREGVSAFYKDRSGNIYHTYSSYARGIDLLNTTYNFLDLTAKGRDENPERRQDWVRYHDKYKNAPSGCGCS